MPGSRLEKQGNGLLEAKRRRKSAAGAEVGSPATYPTLPDNLKKRPRRSLNGSGPREEPLLWLGGRLRRWRGQPAVDRVSSVERRQASPSLICPIDQAYLASLFERRRLRSC
jgi:hypothetical protein